MRSGNDLRGLVDLCCMVREAIGKNLIVVEIGSLIGESTLELALHFSQVYAIDTWDYPNTEAFTEPKKGQTEAYFDRVAKFAGNITKVKGDSVAVARAWKGPMIDLLYVDGDHRYAGVKADLDAWTGHVRLGGFVGGHDYDSRFEGVKRAVDEKFRAPDATFCDDSWLKRLT